MKTTRLFLVPVVTALLLAACAGPFASMNVAQSSRPRETDPSVSASDLRTLVDGNNAFALDIYQALRSGDGNLILSPYSISLALAMTYAGARGSTESQMADVLHFPHGQTATHPSFNTLDLALAQRGDNGLDKDREPMKLNIANAVWAEQTFPFLEEYLDTIAVNYGAGIHLADFIHQSDPARREINSWVSKKTEDKINDLLPDGSVGPDTRMILVNAIYFKADWVDRFDADSTADQAFHLMDGTEVTVEMMNQGMHNIPYMQGDGYQAIELPYAGGSAAMDIIVPDQGNFEQFESSFNQDSLEQILDAMQPATVQVGLPKFGFTKESNLSDTLKDLGMQDAFNADTADFSGMTGDKDLFISNVVHKAFVAVDEEGTEAAAATAVIMETTSAPFFELRLTVDRPFVFIIRDTSSGQILFIGRVLNPNQ